MLGEEAQTTRSKTSHMERVVERATVSNRSAVDNAFAARESQLFSYDGPKVQLETQRTSNCNELALIVSVFSGSAVPTKRPSSIRDFISFCHARFKAHRRYRHVVEALNI